MTNSEKFKGVFGLYATELWAMPEEDFLNWINTEYKESESAQPEIIACGDCKHWICHDRRCEYWNHGVKPLDWCSYAERKTDE